MKRTNVQIVSPTIMRIRAADSSIWFGTAFYLFICLAFFAFIFFNGFQFTWSNAVLLVIFLLGFYIAIFRVTVFNLRTRIIKIEGDDILFGRKKFARMQLSCVSVAVGSAGILGIANSYAVRLVLVPELKEISVAFFSDKADAIKLAGEVAQFLDVHFIDTTLPKP